MKKIIINAPRRTSSSYLALMVRHSLEDNTDLFFQKLDVGSSAVGKIQKWATTHQNEIQVSIARNPYDVIVSDIVMLIMASQRESADNPALAAKLLNDDAFFLKTVAVEIKKLEKYYLANAKYADSSHITYKFEDVVDEVKQILVVKDILSSAGYAISTEFDSLFEIAEMQASNGTLSRVDIVVNPANRTELYATVQDKFARLSDSISFDLVNAAYQQALDAARTF
jgi:hypothetical protein